MNGLKDLLLRILKCELRGEAPSEEVLACLKKQEVLEPLYELSKFQDVEHLVGDFLYREKLVSPGTPGVGSKFLKRRFFAVFHSEQQNQILRVLEKVFEAEKIPYLPLKGVVLRDFYPERWMRTASDVDVLVKPQDFERAISALEEKAGATEVKRSFHDVTLKVGAKVPLELHFQLLEDKEQVENSGEVLDALWEGLTDARPGSMEKKMSDEMFYFYHVAHMAKHLLLGGYGIRAFLDLWVLDRLVEHDEAARDALLKKGGLFDLATVARNLSDAWFSEGVPTEAARKLERFLFLSGSFGTEDTEALLAQHHKGGKFRYLLYKIFLPYGELKEGYPILKKHRWLTPFFEVWRWLRLALGGGAGRAAKSMREEEERLAGDGQLSVGELLEDLGISKAEKKDVTAETAMIALVRYEIGGKLPPEEVLEYLKAPSVLNELYTVSKKQECAHLVGDALQKLNLLPAGNALGEKFIKRQFVAAYYAEQQRYLLERVGESFEKEKIAYIPLKGLVLRKLYPEPWMRTAGDLDILVKEADLPRAEAILQTLGGRFSEDGGHDRKYIFPNQIDVELHYRLVEEDRVNHAGSYLDTVWERAQPAEPSSFCYLLSDEDFYFYHLVHAAKHLEGGSCGMRPFLDLWILDHKQTCDKKKRDDFLEKQNLLTFGRAAENLSEYWFSGKSPDELSLQLEKFLLSGGVFGDRDTMTVMQKYNRKGALRYLFFQVFRPYREMASGNKRLQKYPILLPYYWGKRWIRILRSGMVGEALRSLRKSNRLEKDGLSPAELRKALELSVVEGK